MRKQVWIERLRDAVFVLFLISLAITVTINFRWLYHFDIQQLNIFRLYRHFKRRIDKKIMGCCWIS